VIAAWRSLFIDGMSAVACIRIGKNDQIAGRALLMAVQSAIDVTVIVVADASLNPQKQ